MIYIHTEQTQKLQENKKTEKIHKENQATE